MRFPFRWTMDGYRVRLTNARHAPPRSRPITAVTTQLAAAKIEEPPAAGGDNGSDESDPLWQVVFKLAGGDRQKTEKMLEDPDALMAYPEVRAVLEGGGGAAPMDMDAAPPVRMRVSMSWYVGWACD